MTQPNNQAVDLWNAAIEAAGRCMDKLRKDFASEHGYVTATGELEYWRADHEERQAHYDSLADIAEEIRSLKRQPSEPNVMPQEYYDLSQEIGADDLMPVSGVVDELLQQILDALDKSAEPNIGNLKDALRTRLFAPLCTDKDCRYFGNTQPINCGFYGCEQCSAQRGANDRSCQAKEIDGQWICDCVSTGRFDAHPSTFCEKTDERAEFLSWARTYAQCEITGATLYKAWQVRAAISSAPSEPTPAQEKTERNDWMDSESIKQARKTYDGAILSNLRTGQVEMWPNEYRDQLKKAFDHGVKAARAAQEKA